MAASTAVAFYSVAVFLMVSFGSFSLPKEVRFEALGWPVTVFSEQGHLGGPPSGERWYMEDMVRVIADDPVGPKTLSYSGPDTIWFNSAALGYYSTLHGIRFSNEVEFHTGQYGVASADKDSRFVAVRTDDEDAPATGFVLLEHYELPDGSHLSLYRRNIGT